MLAVVALAGLNDAVTPVGKPAAVKATVPVKPPCGAMVMAAVSVPPGVTFTFDAEDESLNDGGAVMVRAMVD